ncbi:MAG: prolipoprotein diacylglyceryl transferase [Corallococcus sp.]|nr:prolipoprotein diacylglyceryl transferase [Corallococcus sp.]MCM1359113.1 prolipoprotein diacylglyceryl transferase [Corallococcus sp.]MCM1394503.1 prolipoprotein diacylglyceryl transferase [Corallococcus sp.]
MIHLLSFTEFVFGNETFGFVWDTAQPYLSIFTLHVNLYAIAIVTGMLVAILVAARYFKKRGYDPYDATVYALVVIPFGVLGARLYVYIFPWSGRTPDWSGFFSDFRNGGLGIYGGVILGYISAFILCKIKKQDFRIITDSLLPGVMIAQSLGRWGNFFNQEAFGRLISTDFNSMINFWGASTDHAFNGYAVWIDAAHARGGPAGWYEATFFYESVCTLLGFIICVCVLTRSKRYRLGWCTAFYGIYYGIVRLVIEGMRTDSLYLYIGTAETDIKISQLVSVFTIVLGLLLLSQIYRKQLHALYRKMFKTERQELSVSRWVLLGISVVALAVGVTMFVLGGESKFIVGFFATLLAVYSALGIWSLCDRLKLYCGTCCERTLPNGGWQSDNKKYFTETVCYCVTCGALLFVALFSLIKWGVVDKIPNGYVLAVAAFLCLAAIAVFKLLPAFKNLHRNPKTDFDATVVCPCGETRSVKLNGFLLFLFPPKLYRDYSVDNLKPWVDPNPKKRKKKGENAETEADFGDAASNRVNGADAQNSDASFMENGVNQTLPQSDNNASFNADDSHKVHAVDYKRNAVFVPADDVATEDLTQQTDVEGTSNISKSKRKSAAKQKNNKEEK